MKKNYSLLVIIILGLCSNVSYAQVSGTNIFIPGNYVEIGVAPNGSFGAGPSPAGYSGCPSYLSAHPTAGANIAMVYDNGHNGWTTGAPRYYGDYVYPGTPFEGWCMAANGARSDAFYTTGGGVGASFYNQTPATSFLSGSNTSYTNAGGIINAVWTGTTRAGAAGPVVLNITQTTRVDLNASWAVVTTTFTNASAAAVPGVYYWRTCDPDDDVTNSGSYYTTNSIIYQNDVDHRVLVSSRGTSYTAAYMALGTKDCRAKGLIYTNWASYPAQVASNSLANIYNQAAGMAISPSWYAVGSVQTADIAIGLIYNIGTIAPGATATISYAYIFGSNSTTGLTAYSTAFDAAIDSAFPEPVLVVNGVSIPPTGAAPAPTRDTFNACGSSVTTLPVNINFASDKCWTGSTWTWSPSTGLASTTGVTNTISIGSLPPSITYTITGNDSSTGMLDCNARTMYLTILTCNGATVNNPCVGGALTFNAPGDSTGASYSWYGPAPSTTVVGTSQAFTITPSVWADTGLYHVVKTVGTVHDTASIPVTLNAIPTLSPPSSICPGGTETLTATPGGGIWSSSNSAVASIGASSGLVTSGSLGTSTMTYVSPAGCVSSTNVTVATISPITGILTLCQGTTTTLSNTAPGGTWVSGNTPVATIGISSGVVGGVTAGTAPITYTIAGGCRATTTVTVNPVDPITGVTSLCQRRATITLSNAVAGGTWSSANPTIATITPSTGIVYGVTGGVATISYVNPFGCISTIAVTVNPTPPPPGVTPQSYCQYFTPALQLTATGAGPTFTWWGTGLTAGYSPAPTPSTLVAGVDSYYVNQTSSFGCASDSALELVTIRPFPATPVTRDTAYCQYFGSPAPLDGEVTAYTGTLNWYLAGTLLSGTPTPPTATATYPTGTTWYVSQTIDGCQGDSAALNVQIIYLPNFTIATQPWVCQFDSISLAYDPAGPPLFGGSFLWTLPAGASFAAGTNQTDSMVKVQFDSVNSSNYVYLTASDLNGECSTTDTVRIDVIALPTATATSKADVCMTDTVSLALSSRSEGANIFTWYVDASPLFSSPAVNIIASNSNSGGPFSISWIDTGIHVIYVQTTADHGCTDKPTADTVNVHGLPDASFRITTLGGALCLEDSVLFSANDSNYQNKYNWAPAHFFTETDKHAEWGRVELDKSVVTLTITDPFGCVGSSSRELDPGVCCTVPFPNAFTPNGDGKNDVFRPIPQRAYHTYHEFRIQNRWGQTVFECNDNKASWDGTFNGVPQDMGVYFWYLKYDCDGKTMEEKGDCTLIR